MKKNSTWFKILLKARTYHTKNGQPITAPALCVTTKNELLKIYETNRKIEGGHVKKIFNSITTLANILRQVVVVKYDNVFYIADGQHLFTALSNENMPIEFILCEVKEEKELINFMSLMNDSSKRWGLGQFIRVNTSSRVVNAYSKLTKFVTEYYEKTGMTDKVMAAMMYNEYVYNEGASSNAIKGSYFVQNVSDAKLRRILNGLKRFYSRTKMTPTNYLNGAIIIIMYEKKKNYFKSEAKFLKEVHKKAKQQDKLTWRCGNKKDGLQFLSSCWSEL